MTIKLLSMTKDQLVNEITNKTGIDKTTVIKTVESLMSTIKDNMSNNKNIYLRGFGSFVIKKRAKKKARNFSKRTYVIVPEHYVPTFKPVKEFVEKVKSNVK